MFIDAYKVRLLKEWDEICIKVKAGLEKLGRDIPIVPVSVAYKKK